MAPNCCNFAPKENLDIFCNIMSKSLLKEEDNGAISRIGYLKMAQSHLTQEIWEHTRLALLPAHSKPPNSELIGVNFSRENRLVHLQVTSDCFKRQKLPLINEFCHPSSGWVFVCWSNKSNNRPTSKIDSTYTLLFKKIWGWFQPI